jgi:hypothetical protein
MPEKYSQLIVSESAMLLLACHPHQVVYQRPYKDDHEIVLKPAMINEAVSQPISVKTVLISGPTAAPRRTKWQTLPDEEFNP